MKATTIQWKDLDGRVLLFLLVIIFYQLSRYFDNLPVGQWFLQQFISLVWKNKMKKAITVETWIVVKLKKELKTNKFIPYRFDFISIYTFNRRSTK